MNNISFTVIIIIIFAAILFVIPKIIKNRQYKKLTEALSQQNYEEFEAILDNFFTMCSFKPYNREYMRLTAYLMQNDPKKIDTQIQFIFEKLKMKDVQEFAVATRGFYFYVETKNYKKAKEMLEICQKTFNAPNELHIMELIYSILVEHESIYIQEIEDRLHALPKNNDDATTVRKGIFEFLLGLQYHYKNDKKTSHSYLRSALVHCKDTPYEQEIKKILSE